MNRNRSKRLLTLGKACGVLLMSALVLVATSDRATAWIYKKAGIVCDKAEPRTDMLLVLDLKPLNCRLSGLRHD
ncbi:TPA: hypothetical protein ACK3Q6_008064 [Burkholderia cepacia]